MAGQSRNHYRHLFNFWPAGDAAKIFLYKLYYFFWIYITTNSYSRIIGAIPAKEKVFQIICIYTIEIFYISYRKPAIGVTIRIHVFCNIFLGQAIRAIIIILSSFIFYSSSLHFEFWLGYCIKQE